MKHTDARTEEERLRANLADYEDAKKTDPLTNPVRMLALDLLRAGGEDLGDYLDTHLQRLTARSFNARARSLAAYVGELDTVANRAAIAELAETTALGPDKAIPFEDFKEIIERPSFGIVLTAHPTFGLRRDLRRALCEVAAGETVGGAPLDDAAVDQRLHLAADLKHGPDGNITLDLEHEQAEEAIVNIQNALRIAVDEILSTAADHYPDDWRTLVPQPLTVASWVGYDLDGRNDIGWLDILKKRMRVRRAQLRRYLEQVGDAAKMLRDGDPAAGPLAAAQRDLEAESALCEHEFRLFEAATVADPASVKALSAGLAEAKGRRINDTGAIVDNLADAVSKAGTREAALRISALRAIITCFGLGTAHVHLRVNASHLHNAIARAIGMKGAPEDPGSRRRYLSQLTLQLDKVEPASINFGSLLAERTTARSVFMVIRQMLSVVDAATPVRLLIAEADTSFTVLAAVYFAKLFGVEKNVDISPLFETPVALEKGADIIDELLDNPHYLAYVRGRGRLCIQTGFSDAGRYLGQLAASMAVERLHMKLARLLQARGITDIEVVIFDTHGESIGRGAHPVSLAQRFSHLASPMSRSLFADADIPLKQEISFQGGDGYCLLATPRLALGTVTQVLAHAMTPPPEKVADPFYDDPDHTLDFFLTITRFNDDLMRDRDYGSLVGTFGVNMTPKMGSRTVKRQHEAGGGIDRESPTQIRAISHNAILHQVGWLANTVGGVGMAIHRNLSWFTAMYEKSDRMRQMITMAHIATSVGSVDAMLAYARVFDPSYWLARALTEEPSSQRDRLRQLARYLDDHRHYERMSRICRRLAQDYIDLAEGVAALPDAVRPEPANRDSQDDIKLLHAIRLAAIQQIFLLATRIPRFASKLDFTREDVVRRILFLDVTTALEELREIFPATPPIADLQGFGSEATYTLEAATSYAEEHREIFDPIEALYAIVLRTSAAISYHTGAHG